MSVLYFPYCYVLNIYSLIPLQNDFKQYVLLVLAALPLIFYPVEG